MDTYVANEQDQKRAENIRRQYVSRKDNRMEQLQKLDNKVKAPGRMIASMFGVIGVLALGAGMSLITVWGNMQMGLLVSIPGLAVALLAYPVYAGITNSRKKQYAAEIMRLSDDVMAH